MISEHEMKDVILKELPKIIEHDTDLQDLIINLARRHFPDKRVTEDRFDRIMDELRIGRELLEAHIKQQDKLWEQQNTKWEQQDKKWWDNQKVINEILADIKKLSQKHDSTMGAIGSRWGVNTEESFRSALKSILEDFEGVQVENITIYDKEGVVFGRPDQVELDIIIRNGVLIIAEIKSSISRSELHSFNRKIQFYENLHNRTTSRKMVISPMVESKAMSLAKELGIEVFSYAEDVKW